MNEEQKTTLINNIRNNNGGAGYQNLNRTYYSDALERKLVEIETFIESDLADMENEGFDIAGALRSLQKLIKN